jgi:hypothetical protein
MGPITHSARVNAMIVEHIASHSQSHLVNPR